MIARPSAERATDQAVLDAAVACIARWGVAKTTLEDVAREARCSRATVYRLFPGGKQLVLESAARREIDRLLDVVGSPLATAPSLETALVDAMVAAGGFLKRNAALQTIIAHEPELLLPVVSFDQLDPLLAACAATLGPLVERFVDPTTAGELIEWCARLMISYTSEPSERVDLSRVQDVEQLVRRHLLPGVAVAALVPTP